VTCDDAQTPWWAEGRVLLCKQAGVGSSPTVSTPLSSGDKRPAQRRCHGVEAPPAEGQRARWSKPSSRLGTGMTPYQARRCQRRWDRAEGGRARHPGFSGPSQPLRDTVGPMAAEAISDLPDFAVLYGEATRRCAREWRRACGRRLSCTPTPTGRDAGTCSSRHCRRWCNVWPTRSGWSASSPASRPSRGASVPASSTPAASPPARRRGDGAAPGHRRG
jgi:hypothetical protein